jgi:glycyl-tRNA synthetase beta chain
LTKINFLFEIGTEEIPSGYIKNAIDKIKESFIKDLSESKLSYSDIETYSTPRRLAIKIKELDDSQADESIEKSGPAKKVAYDDNGNLTKAGEGFIKGAGVKENELYSLITPKGEYIAVKVFIKGKKSIELLPKMMKNAIERKI